MSTYSDTLHRTAETGQRLPSLTRHPYSLTIYTAPVSIFDMLARSQAGHFSFTCRVLEVRARCGRGGRKEVVAKVTGYS